MKATFRRALVLLALFAPLSTLPSAATEGPEGDPGPPSQFTLQLPEGWFTFDQMAVLYGGTDKVVYGGGSDLTVIRGGKSDVGVIVFSGVDLLHLLQTGAGEQEQEAMMKIQRGDVPGFFVDRSRAGKGMDCGALSEKAKKQVAKSLRGAPMWGRGRTVVADLTAADERIGGCQGAHFQGSTKGPDGKVRAVDVRAVSDGQILYLFALEEEQPFFDQNLPTFEAVLASLHLTAAR